MEKPEENAEKKEETTKTTKKSVKIDGISSQINVVPGSPAHQQWARIMVTSGHSSPSACLKMVMDAYENPKVDTDNSAVIEDLQKQIKDLNTHIYRLNVELGEKEGTIDELNTKLEAANNTANENAVNGLGKQAQIEELQKQLEGAIIVKPNPVSAYFLNEMAEKTGTTPEKILEKLFFEDLQNPCSNHLPYIVSSSRIREVMDEMKSQQKPENQ